MGLGYRRLRAPRSISSLFFSGNHKPLRAGKLALWLTTGFMLVEAAIGLWSGSLALLADSSHMLADAARSGLRSWHVGFAERPRGTRSTYGLRRAEVLAAFVDGILLGGVAVITKEAVARWVTPVSVDGHAMMLTAGAGLYHVTMQPEAPPLDLLVPVRSSGDGVKIG